MFFKDFVEGFAHKVELLVVAGAYFAKHVEPYDGGHIKPDEETKGDDNYKVKGHDVG